MNNVLNWFEIPTTNLGRASAFYEAVLETKLRTEVFGGVPHAVFAAEPPGVGGALVEDAARRPAAGGALLYLNAPNLDACLARVAEAGGRIETPKTSIGPHGFYAVLEDTEGNRIGLHAMS